MPCRSNIGIEIVQGTICKDRSRAQVTIGHPETIPVGRPTPIYVKVVWGLAEAGKELQLEFRRRAEAAGGDDIVFDGPDGGHSRSLTGDAEQLVTIFGKTARVGDELNTQLNIKLDDDEYGVDPPIAIASVAPEPVIAQAEAEVALQREMAIALRREAPEQADEQGIWNRYNAIYDDARDLAEALAGAQIGQAAVPIIGADASQPADFDLAEIALHLRSHRDPEGLANAKAKGMNNAFDRFQGHWRGHWRQRKALSCGRYLDECQDHDWAETRRLAADSGIWLQQVVMGADSRAYATPPAQGPAPGCLSLEPGRDTDTRAINAIDIETGLMVGAVGVKPEADDDGVRSRRPHIGFYVEHGKLLWVAEEGRDGNRVSYSVFYEVSQGEDDQPMLDQRYTITGFQLHWDRDQKRIDGAIETKAGEYRRILSDTQRQLEEDYRARRLQQGHLDDMPYRRRLEFSHPDVIQAFFDLPANADRRDYLERLREFTRQQQALRTAPLGRRESITFIMGGAGDGFYAAAARYFELNPTTHVEVMDGDSLRDVRDHLRNHPPTTPAQANRRRWGRVNIVVHANEWGAMTIPVLPGGDAVDEDSLRAAVNAGDFDPLPDALFDVRTRFTIRGCDIGRNQAFVDFFSEALGDGGPADLQRPQTFAPRSLQSFGFWTLNNVLFAAEQSLVQSWYVVFPMNQQRSRNQLRVMFDTRHGAAPGVDWNDALGRTDERYRGDVYRQDHPDPADPNSDPIELVFTVGHANAAALPVIGTPQQQSAWVNAQAFIAAWVNGLGLQMGDLQWTAVNDAVALTTTATGLGRYVSVQRTVTAGLQRLFNAPAALQADLDRRQLSVGLKASFKANNQTLSKKAYITIRWTGNQWLITDPEQPRTFALRRGPGGIEVELEGAGPGPVVPLFHIPATANTRTSLNNFIVPTVLRNGFPAASPLSRNVAVIVRVEHRRWLLFDNDNANLYAVSRIGGRLNVYSQPQAAHPAITDPRFFGMRIPATPPTEVWGENVTP